MWTLAPGYQALFPGMIPVDPYTSPVLAVIEANGTAYVGSGHKYPERWLKRHTLQELDASRAKASIWAEEAREAAQHSWNGYREKAWGYDQIHPKKGTPNTWFNLGLSIVEGLDTLWLLGLREEFDEAQTWIERHLDFEKAETKLDSFFEATIRLLGGLLGAHSLSQRPIFLKRAQELGDRLISAWPEGAVLPNAQVDIGRNFSKHLTYRGRSFSTAEVGSCQLEFRYLSQHTGDPTYAAFADQAFNAILAATPGKGLVSANLLGNEKPVEEGSTITMGAHGDSYYEYLIKQYLQTSQTEPHFLNKWLLAMKEMEERLLQTSKEGLMYIAKENDGSIVHEFDHLACFVAGMLMQGLNELPSGEVPESYRLVASNITHTCWSLYDTKTGLPPEIMTFEGGVKRIKRQDGFSLLRPEAAEAMYYMWYYTGDHKYREWAHKIVQSLNQVARVTYGYSSVKDVDSYDPILMDGCESFFFAETIKYLYLIQADPELLPLDKYVFNTEAHPLRIWVPETIFIE